jgi:hypothetical protein
MMSNPSWGVYACRYAPLPDKRLRDRLVTSIEALATQTTPVPETPPPLATAVRQLACLGGHRGYRSTGSPGVKVLWRGFQRLQAMVAFYQRCCQQFPGFHLGLLTETICAPPLRTGIKRCS